MRGQDPTAEELAWDPAQFEKVSDRSDKIRCRDCGATGYPEHRWRYSPDDPWIDHIGWWGHRHERGHPWVCSEGDARYTTPQGLAAHRRHAHP